MRQRPFTRGLFVSSWYRLLLGTSAVLACLSGLLFAAPAQATQGIPYLVNFQGRLTDNNGNILPDGYYNIKFRIFDAATSGTNLWEEDRVVSAGPTDNRVHVVNGLFSVSLGSVNALSPSIFNTSSTRYLEVELPSTATNTCSSVGCASWTEGPFSPRHTLAASPYAFVADTLDGLDSTDFGQITAANSFTGTNTFSKSGGAGIVLSGTPATSGSLLQIGSTLSSGNSSGTLIGANGSFSGDLLNLQVSNNTKLKVDNSGNLTLASGAAITVGASAGASTTCSSGTFLQNQTTVGGIVTGGTCVTPTGTGASTTLNNLGTTSIDADLLPDSNNARNVGSAALVWSHVYAGLVDAGSTTTTLGVGTANASAITIGKSGTTTTFNGPISVAAGQNLSLAAGTGTFSQTYQNNSGTATTISAQNTGSSGTNTVKGQAITLTGTSTSGTNNTFGLDFTAVTNPGGANNYYALNFGTGFTDLLRYNNSTTLISGSGQINGAQIQNATVANASLANSSITINGTGISGGGAVSLGGSLTLSTAYGSASNTAVQGNITLVCPSGSGNVSGSGNTITLGSGGSCNALSLVNNPTFTGQLTLSGNGAASTPILNLSGTPTANASTSLVQFGNAISTGNAVTNGGTYLGINLPSSSAGSAADFLNLQKANTVEFKVDNSGNGTFGGNLTLNGGTLAAGATTALTVTGNAASVWSTSTGNLTISAGASLILGSAANGMTFDSSTHEPALTGTAQHTRQIQLQPEYPGATFTADGTNNTGTLTSDNQTTSPFRNYYKWTTTQGTAQDYDIWVKVPLPSDFASFTSGQTICMDTYASASSANLVNLTVYDSANAAEITSADLSPGTVATWTPTTTTKCTGSITAGSPTYTAGSDITLDIKLTAPATTGDVRIGAITFNYLSKW